MMRLALPLVLILTLAACKTSEERAEEHYQTALSLLAEGDLARATVEFRNVFELNGLHIEARRSFAEALRANGDQSQAYGQFLRLAEQLPDDVGARLALAEMAIESQTWPQLQVHGPRLLELVPAEMRAGEEGRRIDIVAVTRDYAKALEDEAAPARRAAAARAAELLEAAPGNLGLYRVLVDNALRDGERDAALAFVDRALTVAPDNRDLHNTRLGLLAQAEDAAAVRAQIETMIERFPEDRELVGALLRFHVSQGDTAAAEAFLRQRVQTAATPEEADEVRAALVQFVLTTQGPEAALAEIDAQIAATGGNLTLRMMQATILFDTGARDEAIAQVTGLIEAGEGTQEQIGNAKVVLAGMLVETGNPVGARRLVGEVLEADPGNGTALRLESAWLIEEDRADQAITLLRRALDEEPDDTDAMTLMASAHSRNGNHELARDFLALAYEASNAAPAETLRYARNLAADERYLAAEEALVRALRLQSGNLQLLDQLGRVYIAMEDWARAEGVEDAARRQNTEAGAALAAGLRVARLTARGQTEDALSFLQDLAGSDAGQTAAAAQLAVIGTLLGEGKSAEALAAVQTALAETPDNLALLMARGAAERASGDIDAAIATYQGLTETQPQFERAWIELIRSEFAAGRIEAARATLDRALATLPDAANLLWAQASFLEQSGDADGAIEIYERLYKDLPNSPVVANNLASLISTYRTDDESLERAYAVARRLRGTEVPAMMDTYGWIAFRRGDIDEARPYLEGAAGVLTDDPLVQYHYGMLLAAAGEREAAIAQLTRALEIAGPDDKRPQFDIARTEIERLRTGGE